MKIVMLLAGILVPASFVCGRGMDLVPSVHRSAAAQRRTATDAQPAPTDLDPALARMMALTGGTWVTRQGKFVAEFHYERVMNGRAIRGTGVIGKDSPEAMDVLTMFGWDPVNKSTYYIDFHGHDTVYKGTVRLDGNQFDFRFACLVGPPGEFRATDELSDKDTLITSIYGKKDGDWVKLHAFVFKRQR